MKSTSREEKIECDVRLGILSSMKSKKIEKTQNKYLEEAYDLLTNKNYDKSTYLYGMKPANLKINLGEIKS